MGCTAVGCGLAKELQVTTNEDKPTYRPVLRYIISGSKNIRIGWVKPAGSFKNIFYIVSLFVYIVSLFVCTIAIVCLVFIIVMILYVNVNVMFLAVESLFTAAQFTWPVFLSKSIL